MVTGDEEPLRPLACTVPRVLEEKDARPTVHPTSRALKIMPNARRRLCRTSLLRQKRGHQIMDKCGGRTASPPLQKVPSYLLVGHIDGTKKQGVILRNSFHGLISRDRHLPMYIHKS